MAIISNAWFIRSNCLFSKTHSQRQPVSKLLCLVDAVFTMGSRQESKLSLKANHILPTEQGSLDVPCKRHRFLQPLRRIYKYYSVIALSPINFTSSLKTQGNAEKIKFVGYTFVRLLSFVFVLHNVLLFVGFHKGQFGELDIFELLESTMWFVGVTMPLVITDTLVRSTDFNWAFLQSMVIMENIWSRQEFAQSTPSQYGYWKSILIHNSIFDYFQILNICYSMWRALEYQIYPYSVLPWKNSTTELISYVLLVLQSYSYMLAYSFCWVFPGLLARCIAACVSGITERVGKPDFSYEQTVHDYTLISYAARRLSDLMKYKLLVLYIIIGAEQSIQFYVILQILRFGQSFEYVLLMLVDLGITLSRVSHSLRAIASVDTEMRKLRNELNRVSVKLTSGSKRRPLNRWRTVNHACMNIGPHSCNNGLVLDILMEFVDYYATAALWP